MSFLGVFGRSPEKFSLGIFFSPSKPNTIRLPAPRLETECQTGAPSTRNLAQWIQKGYVIVIVSNIKKCKLTLAPQGLEEMK